MAITYPIQLTLAFDWLSTRLVQRFEGVRRGWVLAAPARNLPLIERAIGPEVRRGSRRLATCRSCAKPSTGQARNWCRGSKKLDAGANPATDSPAIAHKTRIYLQRMRSSGTLKNPSMRLLAATRSDRKLSGLQTHCGCEYTSGWPVDRAGERPKVSAVDAQR
jgi:hypothetical protein